jgi:hypothetical protein
MSEMKRLKAELNKRDSAIRALKEEAAKLQEEV